MDKHIPDLLLFPPDSQFADDPLYKEGKIILQDKASCFPAYILSPPGNDQSVVIDATAAPGNKTSHLCALMQNKGKVRISQINLHPQLMVTRRPLFYSCSLSSVTGSASRPCRQCWLERIARTRAQSMQTFLQRLLTTSDMLT